MTELGDDEATVRVILCDDHVVLTDAMSSLLQLERGIDVLATTHSAREVLQACHRLRPDVVLLDHELPDGTGTATVPDIVAAGARVVMLTSFTNDAIVTAAIRNGASGFVPKYANASEVAEAVRKVAAGEAVIAPALLARVLPRLGSDPGIGVTVSERERELLEVVAEGATNEEVARRLHLSPHTVRNHLTRIYARLGARSRLEAVAIAMREGLIERR